jgi:uncharacterized membrane protein YhaH (DUF805 family)
MKAVRDLLGDVRKGCLKRGQFVLYICATLALLLMLGLLLTGLAASLAATLEAIVGKPPKWFFYALILPFLALVGFVWANLLAKRARDMGLPGWMTVVVLLILGQVSHYALPEFADRTIGLIVLAGLALIPSDTFRLASTHPSQ